MEQPQTDRGVKELEASIHPFRIRPYDDSDFQDLTELVMSMLNNSPLETLKYNVHVSLEETKKADASDLFFPDTRILVLEHGVDKRIVGFISYAIQRKGGFYIEYEWVEKDYTKYGYDDKLFQRVEDEVSKAGGGSLYILVSHEEHRFIDFLINRGYQTLNTLELAKYLDGPPKDSGRNIEIEGNSSSDRLSNAQEEQTID